MADAVGVTCLTPRVASKGSIPFDRTRGKASNKIPFGGMFAFFCKHHDKRLETSRLFPCL